MWTNTGEAFSADRRPNYVLKVITLTFIVLECGILNLAALRGWQQYLTGSGGSLVKRCGGQPARP